MSLTAALLEAYSKIVLPRVIASANATRCSTWVLKIGIPAAAAATLAPRPITVPGILRETTNPHLRVGLNSIGWSSCRNVTSEDQSEGPPGSMGTVTTPAAAMHDREIASAWGGPSITVKS